MTNPATDRIATAASALADAILAEIADRLDGPPGVPPTPGTPTTPDAPTPVPGGIDPARWKLTLPVVQNGRVVEINPVGDYSGQFWTRLPNGGYRARVWHGGGTTKRSNNPRAELRELTPTGELAEWSTTEGRHELTVLTQVNRLTRVKPHCVLWQIHGGDDDVTVFRLEGAKLYITDGNDTHAHLVTDRFELGRRYELRGVAENGTVRYWVDGQPVDYTLAADDTSCYFKTGNYLQSNPETAPGESVEEYSEVVLHTAQVRHS